MSSIRVLPNRDQAIFGDIDRRVVRERQRSAQGVLDRARDMSPDGNAAMLAITTTVSSYPTTAASFFGCIPAEIDGSETEGASATFVQQNSTIAYAWNAGAQIPPSGTTIVCHAVGGRWVFRYDG
jgi:hypothetical protein